MTPPGISVPLVVPFESGSDANMERQFGFGVPDGLEQPLGVPAGRRVGEGDHSEVGLVGVHAMLGGAGWLGDRRCPQVEVLRARRHALEQVVARRRLR